MALIAGLLRGIQFPAYPAPSQRRAGVALDRQCLLGRQPVPARVEACRCRLLFKSGAADAEPHRTPLVGEDWLVKTPPTSTSQTGTAILSYHQLAKFQKRRQGAARPDPWHSSKIILYAAGLPNKRILAPAAIHFCASRCYRCRPNFREPFREFRKRQYRRHRAGNPRGDRPRQRGLRARLRQRRLDQASRAADRRDVRDARSRYFWCRPAPPPMRWRSPISRRPGARCCATSRRIS